MPKILDVSRTLSNIKMKNKNKIKLIKFMTHITLKMFIKECDAYTQDIQLYL